MPTDNFPPGVADKLKWYVYRLIDPRNGETFYVGKGQGERVFEHARGAVLASDQNEVSDPKLQRIKDIQLAGLEVSHIIHRHGLTTSRIAYEVEAALIDAYPGLSNKVRGIGSADYGSRHVAEIIAEHTADEFKVAEPLMCISINNRYYTHSTYDAVRCAWRVDIHKAKRYKLVLAHVRGLVVGAYRPNQPWIEATVKNFPGLLDGDMPGRRGFDGKEADDEIRSQYVGKRVPERFRKKGARSPVRYYDPVIKG